MNSRRRAIRRAFRLSLYWSTAWRVAEAAVQRGEITVTEITDGLPPEFDRAKLRRAIDALAGGRGTLRELIDDAPESILRPVAGPPRQDTP